MLHDLTRLRGRPRQNESEVGRDKLIEQSRKVMKLRPKMDIQRREIADIVGVTPALINYYFPDKWTLLEAAAYPYIRDLVTAVEQVLDAPSTNAQKLEGLISTYLMFQEKSGYALYYYIISSKKLQKRENFDILKSTRSRVYDLIRQNLAIDMPNGHGAATVHAMLWSVCECLGRLPFYHRGQATAEDGVPANVKAYRPLVLELFLHGVLSSRSRSRISTVGASMNVPAGI